MPKRTPCRDDQYRNPDTKRCKLKSKKPCKKPGQRRNPLTNRCKQKPKKLIPCKPHQFRNPLTNRCKNKKTKRPSPRVHFDEVDDDEFVDEFVYDDDDNASEEFVDEFEEFEEDEEEVNEPDDVDDDFVSDDDYASEEEEDEPVDEVSETNDDDGTASDREEFVDEVDDHERFNALNSSKRFSPRPLDPVDLCVNHAQALTRGGSVALSMGEEHYSLMNWYEEGRTERGVRRLENGEFVPMPSMIMDLMDTSTNRRPFPRYLKTILLNVKRHATLLNLFSSDGANATLWYYDPGSGSAFHEQRDWRLFDETHRDKPWFQEIRNTTEITRQTVQECPTELMFDFQGRLVYFFKQVVAAWKNSSRYEEIKVRFDVWRQDRENVDHHFPLDENNATSAIYILSQLLEADHIQVFRYYESTPMEGPQLTFNDGLDSTISREIGLVAITSGAGLGACAVWTSIYSLFAESFSRKMDNAAELIRFMRDNPLMGERSARDLLAKAVHLHSTDTEALNSFTALVFHHLPTFRTERMRKTYFDQMIAKYRGLLESTRTELHRTDRVRFLQALLQGRNVPFEMVRAWGNLVTDGVVNDKRVLTNLMLIASCKLNA